MPLFCREFIHIYLPHKDTMFSAANEKRFLNDGFISRKPGDALKFVFRKPARCFVLFQRQAGE